MRPKKAKEAVRRKGPAEEPSPRLDTSPAASCSFSNSNSEPDFPQFQLSGSVSASDLRLVQQHSDFLQYTTSPPTQGRGAGISEAPSGSLTEACAQPQIAVSNFDYSVQNHFESLDEIDRMCGSPDAASQAQIERLSNSITFLRDWDFNSEPRRIKFSSLHDDSLMNDVVCEVTLPQFSAASVPKKELQSENNNPLHFSRDFVLNAGGSVWGVDWCPKANQNSSYPANSEFVAIAAHPPDSPYHKMGARLTGRGSVQIWCFLTAHVDEDLPLVRSKKNSRRASEPNKVPRPRGRPRKNPCRDTVERIDAENQYPEPLATEERVSDENLLKKLKTGKEFPESGNASVYPQCCEQSSDASSNMSLPRMMLCIAHDGHIAWDIKWRPVDACNTLSTSVLGYLGVLLGNGALEVWEVPHPHTVRRIYTTFQANADPRFIKLRPVFRCSFLKCGGDRQSIPLTLEWSPASPHDMILAGCHDGVVALWKFSIADSEHETKPLLCFSADAGPIRTLAWAPVQNGDANIIITAGHRGFKFWDIRNPFLPLWDHALQGITHSLGWLSDPRCVLGCIHDGTVWLISLEKAARNVPVSGKSSSSSSSSSHGGLLHNFDCSSFSIASIHSSPLTGMVAYCGEEGSAICFRPTSRSIRDPSRNRTEHYLCSSLSEEGKSSSPTTTATLVVSTTATAPTSRFPAMKRSAPLKGLEKRQHAGDEVLPAKSVGLNRVRWSPNKATEKWVCYGGVAGLLRCHELHPSCFR